MKRVLVLVGALAACGAAADSPAAVGITIPLVTYLRDLKLVRVVANADSLSFLLDTGGGTTLITPELARRIGCVPRGRAVGHRMTGERVVFQHCDSLRLRSGAWEQVIAPIAVFDVNGLLPPELPRLDGVLALDAFRGAVVTLDWTAGTLTLHDPGSAAAAVGANGLPMRAATGLAGRFLSGFVPVAGRQDTLWFLLDSGNLRGTLVAGHLVADSALVMTGPGIAEFAVAGRARFTAPITPADLELDGVFGTDFLRRGPVTLDLGKWTP